MLKPIGAIGLTMITVFACGLASQSQAIVLVASFDSDEILRYDNHGVFIDVFAGLSSPIGLGPTSLALGPDGNVYAVTSFGDINRFDAASGALLGSFGTVGNTAITFGPNGNLFAADFNADTVFEFDVNTMTNLGAFVLAGSGGLDGPEDLTFGPTGNLYVTSRISGQVLQYDGSNGDFLNVFATPGGNGPVGLAFGSDGNLYVVAAGAGTTGSVERYDGATGNFLGVFSSEESFFSGEGRGIAFDPSGHLLVTTGSSRDKVMRFNGQSGEFIDDFIPAGSGGLNFSNDILVLSNPVFAVPEPITATLGLMGLGVLGMAARRGMAV